MIPIPCDVLPTDEMFRKRYGIKKSLKEIPLLNIYKYFMPWQIQSILRRCGYMKEADYLESNEYGYDYSQGLHDDYVGHTDRLVREICK